MSWERPSDVDLIGDMLEKADIDFERLEDEERGLIILIGNSLVMSFEDDGEFHDIYTEE